MCIRRISLREYFSGYPKEMKKFQNYMHLTDETNALFLLSWLALDYCTKTRGKIK